MKHLPADACRRARISLLPHAFSSPSTFFPLFSVLHLMTCRERNGTQPVHKWNKNKSGRKQLSHLRAHLTAVWIASLILPAADSQVELISSTIQSTICNSARRNNARWNLSFIFFSFSVKSPNKLLSEKLNNLFLSKSWILSCWRCSLSWSFPGRCCAERWNLSSSAPFLVFSFFLLKKNRLVCCFCYYSQYSKI